MPNMRSISDPNYINSQYQNASNLNARIRLHQLFSTNKYGWYRWLFDQFKFQPHARVLELGCGGGNLWLANLDRLPEGSPIILSDLSAGMLDQAQLNLSSKASSFQFEQIDAQSIPYEDDSFDLIIASHMLYHVPERAKALAEIRRVLRPSGWFYASTLGRNDLKELGDLVSRFDPGLSSWRTQLLDTFTLENGAAQLGEYFTEVYLNRYPDSLVVTDARALTDYILSGRIELSSDRQVELAKFVEAQLSANDGKLYITKDAGVFEASLSGV